MQGSTTWTTAVLAEWQDSWPVSSKHAFVDESARGGYLLCAVVLAPETQNAPQRRRRARSLRPHVPCIHEVGGERFARDACLRTLVPDLLEIGVQRVVLESCDQDYQDRQVIARTLGASRQSSLNYIHDQPSGESLLWLPDMLAWAYGRGGEWRRRAELLVASVRDVDL